METAIKRAIEGGWNGTSLGDGCWFGCKAFDVEKTFQSKLHVRAVLLDPLFWQALGKAEGWKWPCVICDHSPSMCSHHRYEKWQANWHIFIDHLAEGKDVESFFKDFLK